MAVERLKIRCYRCNQLLAVSPNKVGAIVSCPKCQAELLIPRQEAPSKGNGSAETNLEASQAPAAKVGSSESGSMTPSGEPSPYLSEIAALIPPDVAALRPEDLRVEAEFFETLTRAPSESSAPRSDPFQFPAAFGTEMLPPEPEPAGPPSPAPVFATAPAAAPAPPPLPSPAVDVVVPPIQLETAPILPPATETRRIREVTLPATVVLAWSLFVLFSTALSFIAGLMIGHFLWKTTP
jgi:phage FluMu protein Com